MDDEPPTLRELAEKEFYFPGFDIPPQQITHALKAAGISPDDENERRRYVIMVKAHRDQIEGDQRGTLGDYLDKALADLGPDATEDELLQHASELKLEVESSRTRKRISDGDVRPTV